MGENDHANLKVLKAQFAEVVRRVEEIRADVRAEQAETRTEMRAGFAGINKRLRTVETENATQKEQLSTWRLLALAGPVLSGLFAGIVSFARELIALFR